MSQQGSVVGTYARVDAAESAVRHLAADGFPLDRVSVITRTLCNASQGPGPAASGNGKRTGVWAGKICALLAGVAIAWVPGVGTLAVAGALTPLFLGGLDDTANTGPLGWLAALGVGPACLRAYEEGVRAGQWLVLAHGTPAEVEQARQILTATSPTDLRVHGE